MDNHKWYGSQTHLQTKAEIWMRRKSRTPTIENRCFLSVCCHSYAQVLLLPCWFYFAVSTFGAEKSFAFQFCFHLSTFPWRRNSSLYLFPASFSENRVSWNGIYLSVFSIKSLHSIVRCHCDMLACRMTAFLVVIKSIWNVKRYAKISKRRSIRNIKFMSLKSNETIFCRSIIRFLPFC